MKKLALVGLALALAGGTFVVVKTQTCGGCCNESVQDSTTVAGGSSGGDRVAAGVQK